MTRQEILNMTEAELTAMPVEDRFIPFEVWVTLPTRSVGGTILSDHFYIAMEEGDVGNDVLAGGL